MKRDGTSTVPVVINPPEPRAQIRSSAQATGRDGAALTGKEETCQTIGCGHVKGAHHVQGGPNALGACCLQSCTCTRFAGEPAESAPRIMPPDYRSDADKSRHAELLQVDIQAFRDFVMPTKDTNPKDAVGTGKAPISTVSAVVLAEVGVAMLEGARKYGRANYRVSGVRASVYYDAVVARHMAAFWEGEDIDPDSGLSHITKAIASLVVLRDSMIQGNWIDDRPPPSPAGWLADLNKKAAAIVAKYPDAKEAFLATDSAEDTARKLGR